MKPVRLQLSRKRGFSLQALSQATNGLPAVNVARPSKWGNPFRVVCLYNKGPERQGWGALQAFGLGDSDATILGFDKTFNCSAGARQHAVDLYRGVIADGRLKIDAAPLRDKNLGCWCPPDEPCHADVLLDLANPQPSLRDG